MIQVPLSLRCQKQLKLWAQRAGTYHRLLKHKPYKITASWADAQAKQVNPLRGVKANAGLLDCDYTVDQTQRVAPIFFIAKNPVFVFLTENNSHLA